MSTATTPESLRSELEQLRAERLQMIEDWQALDLHAGKTRRNWDELSWFLSRTHSNCLAIQGRILREGRDASDLVEANRLRDKADGIRLAIAFMARCECGGAPLTLAHPQAGVLT